MQSGSEDRVMKLAVQLRKNMLSADDFQRELTTLSRGERSALVECLDRIEKGPIELKYSGRPL
jgi:hypothetical protein